MKTQKTLPGHETTVKDRVTEMHEYRVSVPGFYQVWQPTLDGWLSAVERNLNDPDWDARCVSDFVKFPEDHVLAALVYAKSIEEVTSLVWTVVEHDLPFHVQVVQTMHSLREIQVGDVIVPPGFSPLLIKDEYSEVLENAMQ